MLPICNLLLKAEKPEYRLFPSETDKSLGACLKRRRLALKWTQMDCASHFGILKDSYQKWEWNRITPDIKRRNQVIQFLKYNYWDDGSNSLANKTLNFRIKNQLKTIELGIQLGVSESTIKRVENRHENVSDNIKNLISDYIMDN